MPHKLRGSSDVSIKTQTMRDNFEVVCFSDSELPSIAYLTDPFYLWLYTFGNVADEIPPSSVIVTMVLPVVLFTFVANESNASNGC